MQLCFQNDYRETVWIAVMWWDPDGCGQDGNWGTRGWWGVDPGQGVSTNVWTGNRYFYMYAEAADGARWTGPYGPVDASDAAFDSCVDIGSSADNLQLGMQEIDAGWWHWADATCTVSLD